FANLRSSRETELCQKFPVHVVCKWIGNTPRIAQQHYLQVTDQDFAKAIAGEDEAAQKAAQQTAAKLSVASHQTEQPTICEELRGIATPNKDLLGRAGIEPATHGFSIHC